MFKQEQFKDWLDDNDCKEEITNWVGDRNLEQAWAECPTGSWLLRIAQIGGICDRLLVQAAFECVQRIEYLLPKSPEVDACWEEIEKYLQAENNSLEGMERAAIKVNENHYASLSFYEVSGWAATALADIGCNAGFNCESVTDNICNAVCVAAGSRAGNLEAKACAYVVRKVIPFSLIAEKLEGVR
ncbi:MAG: hypothetical protein GY861_02600 [bacterium]|nr:hypothetical protein [bacterium]